MGTRVAFVIDVECRGDDAMRNGILSIGVCIGRLDRLEVLEKHRFDLQPMLYSEYDSLVAISTMKQPGASLDVGLAALDRIKVYPQTFEERCQREFWSKHQDKLKVMQKNAIDPLVAIKQFRALLDRWDDKKRWEAVVISDNVTYDCRMINHYLSVAGLKSLSYDSKGNYRPNFDTDCYARGVEKMTYESLWVNDSDLIKKYHLEVDTSAHDHFPENDAEVIYRLHVGLVQKDLSAIAAKQPA